jgi:uncharacterized membrane-anchored protein YhcB (DUF1043 family)
MMLPSWKTETPQSWATHVNTAVSVELQDHLATISQEILSNIRLQKIVESFRLYEKERQQPHRHRQKPTHPPQNPLLQ